MIIVQQKITTLDTININPPNNNMIDMHSTTSTRWDSTVATDVTDNGLIATFKNDGYDSIAVGRMNAQRVVLEIYNDNGDLVYSASEGTYARSKIKGWSDYYLLPLANDKPFSVNNVVHFYIPYYTLSEKSGWSDYYSQNIGGINVPKDGNIKIYFEASPDIGSVDVGYLVGGKAIDIGDTLYPVTQNIVNNSVKNKDGVEVWKEAFFEIEATVKQKSFLSAGLSIKIRDIYNEVVFAGEPNAEKFNYFGIFGRIEKYGILYKNPVGVFVSINIKEEV